MLGRISLGERSVRLTDLHLTAHNTEQETDFHASARFEPAIPASEPPQSYAGGTGKCDTTVVRVGYAVKQLLPF